MKFVSAISEHRISSCHQMHIQLFCCQVFKTFQATLHLHSINLNKMKFLLMRYALAGFLLYSHFFFFSSSWIHFIWAQKKKKTQTPSHPPRNKGKKVAWTVKTLKPKFNIPLLWQTRNLWDCRHFPFFLYYPQQQQKKVREKKM